MRLSYQVGGSVLIQGLLELGCVGVRQLVVIGIRRGCRRFAVDEEKPIQSECLEYVQDVLVDINDMDNGRGSALSQPQCNDRQHAKKRTVRAITEAEIDNEFFVSLVDLLHGKTTEWLTVLECPAAYYAGVGPIIQARNRNPLGWFRHDSFRVVSL
jgi:hypothetical protein